MTLETLDLKAGRAKRAMKARSELRGRRAWRAPRARRVSKASPGRRDRAALRAHPVLQV